MGRPTGKGRAATCQVWSHYSYRLTPLEYWNPWCASYEAKRDPRTVLGYTRPGAYARMGGPFFRTQRALGERSLVSDAFGKGSGYRGDTDALGKPFPYGGLIADSMTMAGMGIRAHRTAYNVLYGDGHVASFGDPQERFVWHGQGWYTAACPQSQYSNPYFVLANNVFSRTGPFKAASGDAPSDLTQWEYSSAKMWHDLDVHAGVDVHVAD